MDWIVFGDDWGAHPSTTQHLFVHMGPTDRVVWIDSLGMRSPRLTAEDLRRVAHRVRAMAAPAALPAASGRNVHHLACFRCVQPRVIPWHGNPLARAANLASLRVSLAAEFRVLGLQTPVLLASNPVAWWYRAAAPHRRFVYLRLDDYAALPGVDARVAGPADRAACAGADLVVATAQALQPAAGAARRAIYLPQGVDVAHFGRADTAVPPGRTLGFFGLIAEWLDFELIAGVARACPDWRLELLGPVRHVPDGIASLPNVSLRPAVPYEALPRAISGWSAAWAPFRVNELTQAVNPLKLREYLAAGLATACTPIPEAVRLAPTVAIVSTPHAVRAWLAQVAAEDSPAARLGRRAAMAGESWSARAATLRAAVSEADA